MELRYSRTCADIMIYNFDAILEKNDYRFMVIGWDGYSKIKIDTIIAVENWKEIYNEFVVLSDDNKTKLYYQLKVEIADLKATHYVVGELIAVLPMLFLPESQNDFLNELKEWGFVANKNSTYEQKIKELTGLHRFYTNKIGLKESELKEFRDVGEKTPLMKQVVKLERALKKDLIDPKTTSVEKWQYLIQEIKNVA